MSCHGSVNFHLLHRELWTTPGGRDNTRCLEISFTLIYNSYIQYLEDLVEGFLLTVEKCMYECIKSSAFFDRVLQKHNIILLLYFTFIKLSPIKSHLDLAASHDQCNIQFRNITPFVSVHTCTAISGICGYTAQASRHVPWRCFAGKSQEWTPQKM